MVRNKLEAGTLVRARSVRSSVSSSFVFVRATARHRRNFASSVLVLVLVIGFGLVARAAETGSTAEPEWTTDYQQGLEQAQKDKKPVLLDFYAEWCGPCRMMDAQTYRDPRVVKAMNEFVCIKLNVDEQKKAAFAYRVEGIPRVIALNVYGEMIGDIVGFTDADVFVFFLEDAKTNAQKHVQGAIVNVPDGDTSSGEPQVVITAETETGALFELLSSAEPATREKAREECLRRNTPELRAALVQALVNDYLGMRIAAWETLTKLDTNLSAQFDPWAPKAERDAAAAGIK